MSIVIGGEGARGDEETRQVYPPLTSTNYTSWCIRVQAIMEDQGVWEVVEPEVGTSTLSAADAAKATAKDKKVRAHLL